MEKRSPVNGAAQWPHSVADRLVYYSCVPWGSGVFCFVFVFVIMICVAFSASGIDCCNDTDSRFLMTWFCSAEGRSQPTFLQYNMYVCLRLSDSLELRS